MFLTKLFIIFLAFLNLHAATWSSPPIQINTNTTASQPQISASGADNAVAVWDESKNVIKASIFSNGSWQPIQPISNGGGVLTSPAVVMYVQGKAVAIWFNETDDTIESSIYDGTSWSTVSAPFPDVFIGLTPVLAMNNTGLAIIGYVGKHSYPNVAFFDGSWGTPIILSSLVPSDNNTNVTVTINSAEQAVALWVSGGDIEAAVSYGNEIWSTPQVIGAGSAPAVEIDNLGNAQAIWLNGTTLEAATFDGSNDAWSSPIIISSSAVNITYQPVLAIAPSGIGAAVWVSSGDNIDAANYNGSSWGTPLTLSTTPSSSNYIQPQVAINPNTDIYAVWASGNTNPYQILSSFYIDGAWGTPMTVATNSSPIDNEQIAVSPNNSIFSIWQTDTSETGSVYSSTFSLAPLPPQSLSGAVVNNKFLGQTDRIHQLTWTPANDDTVTSYLVTRNGQLIATISALGPYTYLDHGRSGKASEVYTVTSQNGGGVQSSILTVTLK